jgi:leucyl/phenylalanyl-tRNA--protein transferase
MNERPITWLTSDDPPHAFPDVDLACPEVDGLLAAGGDLSQERLLYAYQHGIFPWYEDGQPILWHSPDPRCVLLPHKFHIAKRLRRWLRQAPFEVSFNEAFEQVVQGCAGQRMGQQGTWITRDMSDAYGALHRDGWAHSVEVWNGPALIGGLYGIAIGRAFFGESMFSRESNASKTAMLALVHELMAHDFLLFDCQVVSPHLLTLGAEVMPRHEFSALLKCACAELVPFNVWPTGHTAVPRILAA